MDNNDWTTLAALWKTRILGVHAREENKTAVHQRGIGLHKQNQKLESLYPLPKKPYGILWYTMQHIFCQERSKTI